MTDEMLSRLIGDDLNRQMENNRAEIIRALNASLPKGGAINANIQNLLMSTIQISVQMSVQLTIRGLEEIGILRLPEEGTPILYPLDEE